MKHLITLLLGLFYFLSYSQDIKPRESRIFHFEREGIISLSENQKESELIIVPLKEASKHGRGLDKYKSRLDLSRKREIRNNPEKFKKAPTAPTIGKNFQGNFQNGVPNDNNIAISNDGWIISAVNTNLRIYNSEGELKKVQPLSTFTSGVGIINQPFDPHVIYDPGEDKFIVLFLNGGSSSSTNLILAFSQTEDPMGEWNFYKIPGNVHGDNTWSDYPFPAISDKELFVSVILWQNGESGWDSEATNELIWQIDKMAGYAGSALTSKYYDSIIINGRQVWNTRPIQGGSGTYGPNMYLLANRPVDTLNDSIFLFEITNTLVSGKSEFKTTILRAGTPYGIPPSAIQPGSTDLLRTNYADIHSGFYENGMIQFVGNTRHTGSNAPSVYYGKVTDVKGTPKINTSIYHIDTLDLNYPSIAYSGTGGFDNSALINVLHVSPVTFAGTSVFYIDRDGKFSSLVRVRSGSGPIEVLADTIERWGDYTGIQRKYNEPGTIWLSGSYATGGKTTSTWIAEIKSSDPDMGLPQITQRSFTLYPLPSSRFINMELDMTEAQEITTKIAGARGQIVKEFPSRQIPPGKYEVQLDLHNLSNGIYFLTINDPSGKILASRKIIISK